MNGARWCLVVCGCGTVGFACTRELSRTPVARGLLSATFIDRGEIRGHNAVTCPMYAGHVGRPKCERLAELSREWLNGESDTRVHATQQSVQSVDWGSIVATAGENGGPGCPTTIVLIGLDEWGARLCVVEDLRRVVSDGSAEIVAIQVGLDRDQAQVSAFGSRWDDPCPACGLSTLPQGEPCVLLSPEGRLVRGDLQMEVQAAAVLVTEIVADHLGATRSTRSWVNSKTNLFAIRPGGSVFERVTRTRSRVPGCLGPHSACGPIRWDRMCVAEETADGSE